MGVGAYGSFVLTNTGVDAIKVGLTSETGVWIPETPLYVTSIDGSLENLSNPSRITLSGSIGIMAGQGAVLQGRSVRMSQFVGAFTLDSSSLTMQADAYVGAINYGTASRPQWDGLIAEGTAVVSLNWAEHHYYADVQLNFASGLFLASGRITFDAASGMTLRGQAAIAVPDFVPILGGTILASANFLFVLNPGQEIYAVGWSNFLGFDLGIEYDFLIGKTELIGDVGVQTALASSETTSAPSVAAGSAQSVNLGGVSSASLLSRSPVGVGQGFEYTGQAPAVGTDSMENPAPANLNVVGAIYDLSFRPLVSGCGGLPADWLEGIRVDVEPVAGTVIRVGAPSFDAQLGLGHVTIEVEPASGSEYLQDGLKLRITVRKQGGIARR